MSFLLNSSIIPMLVSMDWFTTILSARSSHCIFYSLVSLLHWVHQICRVNVHACATRAGLEIGRANVQGEHLERGELPDVMVLLVRWLHGMLNSDFVKFFQICLPMLELSNDKSWTIYKITDVSHVYLLSKVALNH